ncbi:hypothetical protein [Avibacterium sp. 21-599]|uniref:hypothetical protein n=1 Tax=Avibacterium sp. 21-599 TaxID=2911528 RepID=UPI0022463F95|nr:hypothetical protein [Avibacterium sp. 21-599]MCW9717629.1 hypothetical protein [Avibacterium sp. 21-599]
MTNSNATQQAKDDAVSPVQAQLEALQDQMFALQQLAVFHNNQLSAHQAVLNALIAHYVQQGFSLSDLHQQVLSQLDLPHQSEEDKAQLAQALTAIFPPAD